jgi:hypothetical protein
MINQNDISPEQSAVLLTLIFTELAAHQFRTSTIAAYLNKHN